MFSAGHRFLGLNRQVETHQNFQSIDVSRRRLLRGAALVAGGGALLAAGLAASPAAAAKLTQAAANYQTTPKGGARCNVCTQWQAPSDCKVVVGPVSPTGWCSLYAAKY
jgi:hypothetical protein